MKKWDLVSSLVLLGLGMVMFMEALKMPFGSLREPQVGFGPLILSVLLAVFSLVLLGQAIHEQGGQRVPFFARPGSWKKIGLTVGGLFAYAFFYEHLGHLLSTFALMVFLLRLIEPLKWWLVIGIALFSSLASYLGFGIFLNLPLPPGILGL